VQRIGPPLLPEYPSPSEAARKGPEEVSRLSREMARGLRDLGLNVNLAPVVDLAGEEAPDWLRKRTLGEDPERVGELAEIFIREHLREGVLPCAKHFPGLGGVLPDPHRELPRKEKPSEDQLRVFRRAVSAWVPLVMTTHLVVEAWGPEPVTFSEKAVEILRKDLGFEGLILTDDLSMGALSAWEPAERLLRALLSGHDLWLAAADVKELTGPLEELSREVEASRVYGRDSVMGQAMTMGMLAAVGLPPDLDARWADKLRQVKPADIQAVARKYFTEDNLTVGLLYPNGEAPRKTAMPAAMGGHLR